MYKNKLNYINRYFTFKHQLYSIYTKANIGKYMINIYLFNVYTL